MVDALRALGLDPSKLITKADCRALVEGKDVGTEEGCILINALLDLAPGFASLADVLGQDGGTLLDLAAQAPQTAILKSIWDEAVLAGDTGQQTVDGLQVVTDSVNAGTDAVVDAINNMAAEVTAALVTVAANTADVANQLVRWDNNGQMSTTSDPP